MLNHLIVISFKCIWINFSIHIKALLLPGCRIRNQFNSTCVTMQSLADRNKLQNKLISKITDVHQSGNCYKGICDSSKPQSISLSSNGENRRVAELPRIGWPIKITPIINESSKSSENNAEHQMHCRPNLFQ